jgi:hypothetical protein
VTRSHHPTWRAENQLFSLLRITTRPSESTPLILNTANTLPDGRRRPYADWRNSSDVVTANPFVVMKSY